MYCPHCMKKISRTSNICPFCNQSTNTSVAGMATLRISCRPNMPLWMMIVQPINYFIGYKVFISVDEQEYVLKSKKKQIDIPVSVGIHHIRISSVSKKTAKALKIAGIGMTIAGAALGSGEAVYAGAAVEDLGKAFSDTGTVYTFKANEVIPYSVMVAWNGAIVEDDKE